VSVRRIAQPPPSGNQLLTPFFSRDYEMIRSCAALVLAGFLTALIGCDGSGNKVIEIPEIDPTVAPEEVQAAADADTPSVD